MGGGVDLSSRAEWVQEVVSFLTDSLFVQYSPTCMLTCIVVWNMHHNKKVHVSIQEKACQHLLFESGKGAVC
jgi:hypothetical protein